MKFGDPICIRQVGNGYIVTPDVGPNGSYMVYETLVFNDLDGERSLKAWLQDHFSAHGTLDMLGGGVR